MTYFFTTHTIIYSLNVFQFSFLSFYTKTHKLPAKLVFAWVTIHLTKVFLTECLALLPKLFGSNYYELIVTAENSAQLQTILVQGTVEGKFIYLIFAMVH